MEKVWFFMECGKCLNQPRTYSLELTPQDNMCYHVSGMERPAEQTGALEDVSSWWHGLQVELCHSGNP
jgi:hypothetical protein